MQSKISKEELESLPLVEYTGNIYVINTLDEAAWAVAEIRAANTIIGFDTETRPSFTKGVVYRVSLVQLSTGDSSYLFRLKKMGGLGPDLTALLTDPNCIKVGVATGDDYNNLRKWDKKLERRGVIEIQEMVKEYGIEDMSLAKIYAILFGMKISKRQRLTNWDANELTERQCHYAALDAVACIDIYEELMRLRSLQTV